jgi:hypothetical protein
MYSGSFFKNLSVCGPVTEGDHTIQIECDEMTDGCWYKMFGVVLYFIVGGREHSSPENYFTSRTAFCAFSERDFWIYSVTLHYTVDRLNLQLSTCLVCLCKYHNSITATRCYPLGNF